MGPVVVWTKRVARCSPKSKIKVKFDSPTVSMQSQNQLLFAGLQSEHKEQTSPRDNQVWLLLSQQQQQNAFILKTFFFQSSFFIFLKKKKQNLRVLFSPKLFYLNFKNSKTCFDSQSFSILKSKQSWPETSVAGSAATVNNIVLHINVFHRNTAGAHKK